MVEREAEVLSRACLGVRFLEAFLSYSIFPFFQLFRICHSMKNQGEVFDSSLDQRPLSPVTQVRTAAAEPMEGW